MQTITIVIRTLPKGKGCAVLTDSAPPAIGHPRTAAQELANQLLRICATHATTTQYGACSATLAGELVQAQAHSPTLETSQ
ncbi:hypothetical protein [Polaromonas sp.]|uniref:hypothetical protein n=1 Tax=Polaromonas sp. TaxID=1869339 RepID=UPI00356355CA